MANGLIHPSTYDDHKNKMYNRDRWSDTIILISYIFYTL